MPVFDSLPAGVRESVVAAGTAGGDRVFAGIATQNRRWRPLRPPMLTAAMYQHIHEVSDRLQLLILRACQRRASTAGELCAVLRVDPATLPMLDPDEPLTEHLLQSMRPDVLLAGGVPKVVEFNGDSSLGGVFDSDTTAARFLAEFQRAGIVATRPMSTPPSGVDVRYEVVRDVLGLSEGSRLALIFSLDIGYPGSDDPRAFVKALDPVCERGGAAGLDVVAAPTRWLSLADDGRLLADGVAVDAVLRLTIPDADDPGMAAVRDALAAGTARMFTSVAAYLLGNKQILGWLWTDLALLDPTDADVVTTHVPFSTTLDAITMDQAIAGRGELVLKPAGGFGGTDVVIGIEARPEQWRAALDAAVHSGRPFVLQEFVEPDRLRMHFGNLESGATEVADVAYSIGAFRYGRRPAGGVCRFGSPDSSLVLNIGRGAHVTGILLV